MIMKNHTSISKTTRTSTADSTQHSSVRESAVAILPPDYGIDFVDSGMAATAPVQRLRMPEEEEPLQGKFGVIQRQADQVGEAMQAGSDTGAAQDRPPVAAGLQRNNTGLPDALKAGIESLSGYAMDDVKVHYNSDRPAQLHALAYAQGTDIHIAHGQERHVPHEAWHVAQQKQGRVKETMRINDGVPVNDDKGLEREADAMGEKAAALRVSEPIGSDAVGLRANGHAVQRHAVVQRVEKEALKLTVAGWGDVEKRLMEGVLDETSADAAVEKVYDNMFELGKDGTWKYKAAAANSNGGPIIAGTANVGMCETYRNAFKVMLEKVADLTADYEPFADGFDIKEGQALVMTKFVTKPNLALLGKAHAYNVSKTLDASTGTVTDEKRYLFSSHWQLIVNGKTYDPLFQSVDEDNMAWEIKEAFNRSTYYATTGGVSFSPNRDAGSTAGGEFGGQYYMITNAGAFEARIQDLDPVKEAHAKLSEVKLAVQGYYNEWSVQGPDSTKAVKDWWTGKTAWHTPIQEDTDKAPQWVTKLTEVMALVEPDVRDDSVLNKVTDTVALTLIKEIRYQARKTKTEIESLIETDETTEVGGHLKTALGNLNSVLQAPIMRDM